MHGKQHNAVLQEKDQVNGYRGKDRQTYTGQSEDPGRKIFPGGGMGEFECEKVGDCVGIIWTKGTVIDRTHTIRSSSQVQRSLKCHLYNYILKIFCAKSKRGVPQRKGKSFYKTAKGPQKRTPKWMSFRLCSIFGKFGKTKHCQGLWEDVLTPRFPLWLPQ